MVINRVLLTDLNFLWLIYAIVSILPNGFVSTTMNYHVNCKMICFGMFTSHLNVLKPNCLLVFTWMRSNYKAIHCTWSFTNVITIFHLFFVWIKWINIFCSTKQMHKLYVGVGVFWIDVFDHLHLLVRLRLWPFQFFKTLSWKNRKPLLTKNRQWTNTMDHTISITHCEARTDYSFIDSKINDEEHSTSIFHFFCWVIFIAPNWDRSVNSLIQNLRSMQIWRNDRQNKICVW